jgi:DNA-directed RNA polymerase specialized sigma24 family protein
MSQISSPELRERREAMQRHISEIAPRLRRRLEGKLIAAGWFDVDDVLSSARRRVDLRLQDGHPLPETKQDLEQYITGMVRNVALEKARQHIRATRRLKLLAQGLGNDVRNRSSRLEIEEEIQRLMSACEPDDRELIPLWMTGMARTMIAEHLGITLQAYRSRRLRLWQQMREIVMPRAGENSGRSSTLIAA